MSSGGRLFILNTSRPFSSGLLISSTKCDGTPNVPKLLGNGVMRPHVGSPDRTCNNFNYDMGGNTFMMGGFMEFCGILSGRECSKIFGRETPKFTICLVEKNFSGQVSIIIFYIVFKYSNV